MRGRFATGGAASAVFDAAGFFASIFGGLVSTFGCTSFLDVAAVYFFGGSASSFLVTLVVSFLITFSSTLEGDTFFSCA